MEDLINLINSSVVQTKVYHVQTTNYAPHIALNGLYDKLSNQFDDLIEQYIGIQRLDDSEYKFPFVNIQLNELASTDSIDELIEYYRIILGELIATKNNLSNKYIAIENCIDNLCASINSFLYLITLK